MQLLMTSEARFERTPDGATWAPGPWGRQLWNRYLTVFNRVRVMARVQAVREPGVSRRSPSVPLAPSMRVTQS